MRQRWRDLLFIHWAVEPALIRPFIPADLELDLFEGRAFLGLVPFTMTGVRPVSLPPVRGLSSFHETNVRTYVHSGGKDPGVWFFSLDAANRVAVLLARMLFHLPYWSARMFLEHESRGAIDGPGCILYAGTRSWQGPSSASYLIRAEVTGPVEPARPGTLEHFLAERYWLYTRWRDRTYQGQVHHTPYPLQKATVLSLDETMLEASGLVRPAGSPLVHYARGVDVDVFPLRRVCLSSSRSQVELPR